MNYTYVGEGGDEVGREQAMPVPACVNSVLWCEWPDGKKIGFPSCFEGATLRRGAWVRVLP